MSYFIYLACITAKIGLGIVSSYLSYHAFIDLNLPDNICKIGGISFVIGINYAWWKYRQNKNIQIFLLLAVIMVVLLDISMSAINLVISEGNDIIKQQQQLQIIESKRLDAIVAITKIEEKKLDIIDDLQANGNYKNARYHSNNFYKNNIKIDNNNDINIKPMGRIRLGFTNLLNDENKGRFAASTFILIISVSITILMLTLDPKMPPAPKIVDIIYNRLQDLIQQKNKQKVLPHEMEVVLPGDKKCMPKSVTFAEEKVLPPEDNSIHFKKKSVTPIVDKSVYVTPQSVTSGNKKCVPPGTKSVTPGKQKICTTGKVYTFSDEKVYKNIINAFEKGETNISALARQFGKSRKTIYKILLSSTDFKPRKRL